MRCRQKLLSRDAKCIGHQCVQCGMIYDCENLSDKSCRLPFNYERCLQCKIHPSSDYLWAGYCTTSFLCIRYGASTNIRVLYLPGHCMMAVKLVPFHPIAIGILFNHYLELKAIERTIAEWKKPSQIPPETNFVIQSDCNSLDQFLDQKWNPFKGWLR